MYLNAEQRQVYNLISDMQQNVWMEAKLDLVNKLGAKFSKDGNMYCWLYGTLPNDCVVGFGETPAKALDNFYHNFYNEKA